MLESIVMLRMLGPAERELLQIYLSEALGANVVFRPVPDRPLPAYLLSTYAFACGRVLSTDYVFAAPIDKDKKPGPAGHAKQVEKLAQLFGQPVVLVLGNVSARDRQRLVRHRTPFIVPFRHMYLPHSGVDFRERGVEANLLVSVDVLGPFQPSTQLVLVYALLKRGHEELHIGELARDLGVSEMTVSRALKDLEGVGLVERWKEGRRRPARLTEARKDIWARTQGHLNSPVKERYAMVRKRVPRALDAGLTALSQLSNLAAPRARTVAMGPNSWREVRQEFHASPLDPMDPYPANLFWEIDQMTVEVWTYDPRLLTDDLFVDPLSLYLSLRNDPDERVQSALKQALEEIPWL